MDHVDSLNIVLSKLRFIADSVGYMDVSMFDESSQCGYVLMMDEILQTLSKITESMNKELSTPGQ